MKIRNLAWCVALLLSMAGTAMGQDGAGDATGGDATTAPAEPVAAPSPSEAAASSDTAAASTGKKISAGLLLGYGFSTDSGSGNPWGLGFGVRGGYNLDKIFLGGRFVYYLGEKSVNIWELGLEGGYDVAVADKLTVRPGIGLGLANISTPSVTILGTTVGGGETDAYIALGGSLLYDVAPDIFVGVDLRYQHIFVTGGANALTLLATGGMRF